MDIFQPISLTAATVSLTKNNHAGTVLVANRAAGIVATLPAATGAGSTYEIVVGTTISSNDLIVKVANASDIMTGTCIMGQDSADTAVLFETAADSDTITMNGSTKGGIKGDRIVLKDVAANLWAVAIVGSGTGTEATPFSASV